MIVVIACDHAGFPLKQSIIETIIENQDEVIDLGTDSIEPVDYTDYAEKLGISIQLKKADRGILICGSGVGACIAANKMRGVYASVCHDTYSAHQGVEHDDMNVLCIGARVIGVESAKEIVYAFLNARYFGNNPGQERFARRVGKIKKLERTKINKSHRKLN